MGRRAYDKTQPMKLNTVKYSPLVVSSVRRDWEEAKLSTKVLSINYTIPYGTIQFWISRWKQEAYLKRRENHESLANTHGR